MDGGLYLWLLLLLPAAGSGLCLVLPSNRAVLGSLCAGVLGVTVLAFAAARAVLGAGEITAAGGWLLLDALSAFHLALLAAIFLLSSVYAWSYFQAEPSGHGLSLRAARRFGSLWFGSLAAMVLVLVSNNLGIMWVGIEATTLLTAFLICTHLAPASLEATWKYLLVCSVGVAFAFIGTLLVGAAASRVPLEGSETLLWTRLRDAAGSLDPTLLKAGFIFLLIGYGTKVGLAPMHSWLPDAHSQAPAPVSAVFSGFLLNAALYCIMRYVPLVEAATGNAGWSLNLLAAFGVLSILVAAAFIVAQHDLKRLLAYHSVEHLGIIALGLGLGGLGTFAALFHTLNHSVCKTLAFFAAGRLGQTFGTHEMGRISGTLRVSPVWGIALLGSLLALIGVAPFALFMSEFQILKAAADGGSYVVLAAFLAGCGVVFVGALRHAISMAWGEPPKDIPARAAGASESLIVFACLAVLLALGCWMPPFLFDALDRAARIVGGRP